MILLAQSKPIGRLNITNEDIARKAIECMELPQVEMPVQHRFAPGIYWRQIFMPAGTFVIGHEHKTTHFNVVLTGRASVLMEGEVCEVVAPCVIRSHAGVMKVLYIHEDMSWATVHANPQDEEDVEKLEESLRLKHELILAYESEIKRLADAMNDKEKQKEAA